MRWHAPTAACSRRGYRTRCWLTPDPASAGQGRTRGRPRRANPIDAEHESRQRSAGDRARIRHGDRWFVPLLGQDARDLLELGLGGPLTGDALQEAIGHDLAVTDVTPKLFLPGLSGLTQGPGFPNLSCLGLLSDRILSADLTAAPDRPTRRSDEHQPIR
jgi:hypothetical protein